MPQEFMSVKFISSIILFVLWMVVVIIWTYKLVKFFVARPDYLQRRFGHVKHKINFKSVIILSVIVIVATLVYLISDYNHFL